VFPQHQFEKTKPISPSFPHGFGGNPGGSTKYKRQHFAQTGFPPKACGNDEVTDSTQINYNAALTLDLLALRRRSHIG
jgi:hypothetical protein